MRFRLAANSIGRRGWPVASLNVRAWAAIVLLCCAQQAIALPLTPFRYEAQAQRHCPGDSVVWLDFRRGRYYLKEQRRYAKGFGGSFVCRNEARESGYRRSLLGLR
ncbi:hypothetical protein [Bradyrhizobium sp. USDA 4454]